MTLAFSCWLGQNFAQNVGKTRFYRVSMGEEHAKKVATYCYSVGCRYTVALWNNLCLFKFKNSVIFNLKDKTTSTKNPSNLEITATGVDIG
jgi:hypothetical protein